jgi:hypothetical protein
MLYKVKSLTAAQIAIVHVRNERNTTQGESTQAYNIL